MAKAEIEQEAVPTAEIWKDALQRADKALGRMSKGLRAAAFVGLIAGITTASQAREGIIESPINIPAEGTETTLEISAAQILPKIVVSSGHEGEPGPEFTRKQESPETVQMPIRSETYVAKDGDTWKSIAEEYGLSLNLLAAANPEVSLWKQPEIGATLKIPSPEEGLKDLQAVVEFKIIKDNLEWDEAVRLAEASEKAIKILGEANIFEDQEITTRTIKIGVADEEELAKWKKVYGDSPPWGVAYLELSEIYLHPNFLSPANLDLLTYNVGHEIGHILTQTRHEDFNYPDGWKDDPAIRAGNAISHYLFPLDRFAEQEFLKKISSSHIKTSEGKKKPE